MQDQSGTAAGRWRGLRRPARLYLAHTALLTAGLAISGLFFNLAILAQGYTRGFLGLLNTVAVLTAALLSLPLWWLAGRLGLRTGLLLGAALQGLSVLVYGLWPAPAALLAAVGLGGAAAVLTEVSGAPLMMRYSDERSRDQLFSASAAINIGVAGLSILVAGALPGLFAGLLGVAPESGPAYRATFLVAGAIVMLSALPLLRIPAEPSSENQTFDRSIAQTLNRSIAPTLDRLIAPTLDRSNAPTLDRSNAPTLDRSNAPTLDRSIAPTLDRSIAPTLDRSIAPTLDRSNAPTLQRSNAPTLQRSVVQLLRLLLTPFLISWGAALLIPYLNLFFKERYGVADQTLGLIFAALGVITGLASLAAPLISRRIGKPATVALTQGLSIPFLLMLGFVPLLGVAVAAALIRAALFNMARPLYNAFVMEQTDEPLRPLVNGLLSGASTAGYLLAPSISTYTQEHYGFGPLFLATTCCYGLAAALNLVLFVRRRPAVAAEELGASAHPPR